MIQLPEKFETYAEARKAGFLRMKQLKEQWYLGKQEQHLIKFYAK